MHSKGHKAEGYRGKGKEEGKGGGMDETGAGKLHPQEAGRRVRGFGKRSQVHINTEVVLELALEARILAPASIVFEVVDCDVPEADVRASEKAPRAAGAASDITRRAAPAV